MAKIVHFANEFIETTIEKGGDYRFLGQIRVDSRYLEKNLAIDSFVFVMMEL